VKTVSVNFAACRILLIESLDEDWEKDFDVEVTEQELEAAKERLKNAAATQQANPDDKVCSVFKFK
jgi:hypothetical protein